MSGRRWMEMWPGVFTVLLLWVVARGRFSVSGWVVSFVAFLVTHCSRCHWVVTLAHPFGGECLSLVVACEAPSNLLQTQPHEGSWAGTSCTDSH